MKKLLLSALLATSAIFNAQALSEGFETTAPGWSVLNAGDTTTWGLWGTYGSGTGAIAPRTGVGMAGIQYNDVGNTLGTHDDYLISPKFMVTANVSDRLRFYARNRSTTFPETFSIRVFEAAPTAGGYTGTLGTALNPSATAWSEYTYNLSAYVGKEIYIAFHSQTTDQWFLGIDDVSVTNAATLAVSDTSKDRSNVSVFPNPFTDTLKISDVKGVKSVSVNDVSGREVKSLAPAEELNLSSLQAGLYIVNLKMEDGSVKTFKTIKK